MTTWTVIGILIVLTASIIGQVYLAIRYVKLRGEILGKKEVRDAAEKEVAKIKRKDPMISCDYCGARIDTRKHRVCPNCGGPFTRDSEWAGRNDVDNQTMDSLSDGMYDDLNKRAVIRNEPRLKRLRNLFILCTVPVVLITVWIATGVIKETLLNCRGNERLNDNSKYIFREADYHLVGDGVIYDDGKVTVTVTGLYVEEKVNGGAAGSTGTVKIGFRVQNRTKRRITLSVKCSSLNGVTGSYTGFIIFDNFKRKSDTTVYEAYYKVPGQVVSEFVITELEVYNRKNTYHATVDRPIVLKTDAAPVSNAPDFTGLTPLFTNDLADVYCMESTAPSQPGQVLCIVNKTADTLTVTNEAYSRSNATRGDKSFFYQEIIPAGYTFVSNPEKLFADESPDGPTGLSLQFRYADDPSRGFSTGYLNFR